MAWFIIGSEAETISAFPLYSSMITTCFARVSPYNEFAPPRVASLAARPPRSYTCSPPSAATIRTPWLQEEEVGSTLYLPPLSVYQCPGEMTARARVYLAACVLFGVAAGETGENRNYGTRRFDGFRV